MAIESGSLKLTLAQKAHRVPPHKCCNSYTVAYIETANDALEKLGYPRVCGVTVSNSNCMLAGGEYEDTFIFVDLNGFGEKVLSVDDVKALHDGGDFLYMGYP